MIEDRQAVYVGNRDHRICEALFFPGLRRALLAHHRIFVHIIAGESVLCRNEIGGNALRHEIGFDRDRWIHRPGAARRADADARHGFHTAADGDLLLAGHNLGRGEIHGLQPRRAEAVDLDARYLLAEIRGYRGRARDIAARFAHRIDAAEHDILNELRLELVPLLQRDKRLAREFDRGAFMQRAIRLAAPARRTDVIEDEGLARAARPGWLRF